VSVIFGLFGGEGHTHEVPLAESKAKTVLLFVMLTFHSIIEGERNPYVNLFLVMAQLVSDFQTIVILTIKND